MGGKGSITWWTTKVSRKRSQRQRAVEFLLVSFILLSKSFVFLRWFHIPGFPVPLGSWALIHCPFLPIIAWTADVVCNCRCLYSHYCILTFKAVHVAYWCLVREVYCHGWAAFLWTSTYCFYWSWKRNISKTLFMPLHYLQYCPA